MTTSPAAAPPSASTCALCERPATDSVEPARRAIERGVDPDDPSFSVTAILPSVPLCAEHRRDVVEGDRLIGWCDDERCRTYGEVGQPSACGEPFVKLTPARRY